MDIRNCVLCMLTAASILSSPAKISGPWHGDMQVGMQSLPIVFNFDEKDGEMTVTLDSPLQGAKDIPAQATLSCDTLLIDIPIIGAQFSGLIGQDRIEGEFSQSGMTLSLSLEPGEYLPPRPQTPKPPFPYETREVEFVNPTDSTLLSGTLSLPIQYAMPFFKDFPAVIFVSGSGVQNRDEEILGHKPFAVMADILAKNGIASLRYDDREFGKSDGARSDATSATYASDAQAAISYVRNNLDRIGNVGVIGHSEGGGIAYMLAADGIPDFVVSMAGPAVSGDSILLLQNEALLKGVVDDAILQQYIAGLRRTLRFMIASPGVTETSRLDNSLSDLTALPPEMKENLRQIVATRNPWIDWFISYNPAEAIGKIRIPVLAINGTLDKQVDAEANLNALKEILPSNPNSRTIAYPGLNHMFQHAKTGRPDEYGLIQETISEEVVNDIINWINSLKKSE